MKIHISLKIFWLALVVFFSAFALLIWVWLIPYGNLEYNLAVNLFTSSIFMVFTIVFLNVLFNARKKVSGKPSKIT
jgi:glucan phosphoethanolaminetransferase (alkaline phosphatase superfamily)